MTNKKRYIAVLVSAAVILSAAAFFTALLIGSGTAARKQLQEEIASLEKNISDREKEKTELNSQLSELETELSTKSTINNYYIEYEKTYNSLSESVSKLKQQSEKLDLEIESTKKRLEVFSGVKTETAGKKYALKADEVYTSPKDIPAGRYTAKGRGTLIIVSPTGKTRVTKNLDVAYDNSYTFNLAKNEQIKVTANVTVTELK